MVQGFPKQEGKGSPRRESIFQGETSSERCRTSGRPEGKVRGKDGERGGGRSRGLGGHTRMCMHGAHRGDESFEGISAEEQQDQICILERSLGLQCG